MKRIIIPLALVAISATSCDKLMKLGVQGGIRVTFAEEFLPTTKASSSPDTNEFILTVTDSKGNSIYDGTYGAAPEVIMTSPGAYTVKAVSCEFSAPLFDKPQYGDSQTVVVKSGETSTARLECSQQNCGIKLGIASDFVSAYPNGVLYLKSSSGKLMYSFTEKRIAYFQPGSISTVLSDGGSDKVLFTRSLAANQMLLVNISVGDQSTGGTGNVKIQVDTSRQWLTEDYHLGGGSGAGSGSKDALSVSQAKSHVGEEGKWVYGYIVGGDLSSSKCSFKAPFSSRTNIVIAAKSSCTDKASCLSVQLAKGDIRDALNLVDNQGNLGRQIYLKGDIVEAYYGIPGIQNITEYEFKSSTP